MPLTLAHPPVETLVPPRPESWAFIPLLVARFLEEGYTPQDVAYFAAAFDHADEMERQLTDAMTELSRAGSVRLITGT